MEHRLKLASLLVITLVACGSTAPANSPSADEARAEATPPPATAPSSPERLVRVEATLSVMPRGDCGGGPGFGTSCPGSEVRVVVFERGGQWLWARVQGTASETTTAAAEAAATPVPSDRIAQMERVIAGVELASSASPYPQCPHLRVDTTTRHVEASGCIDGGGMRAPEAPEPSSNRHEAAWRLLHLLPAPPESPVGQRPAL